jgi:hypothetical protein
MKRVYLGGAFLPKLAKHLALLACLMIVSQAAGRPVMGQLGIFITVVLAALLDSAGRTVRRRLPPCVPLSGGDHDRGAS